MNKAESRERSDRKQQGSSAGQPLRGLGKLLAAAAAIAAFVLWAHIGSGIRTFHSQVSSAPGWQQFRTSYSVEGFGVDSYFTRAVQNGYNLFYFTHEYGGRFTRKTIQNTVHSCSGCHKVEDMAYGFVNSDRFDAKLGRRMSFEDRVMRCYAGSMDGFVPTLYDPAVRDIRILARAIAHHLQLSEGARKGARN
jgi:cytochrome c